MSQLAAAWAPRRGLAAALMVVSAAVHAADTSRLAPSESAPATRLVPLPAGAAAWQPRPGETELRARPAMSVWQAAPGSSALRPSSSGSYWQQGRAPATQLERTQQLLQELQAVEREDANIVLDLPSDVLFDFDKAEIRPDAEPVLAQVRALIQSYEQVAVTVHGHTDSIGSDAYNLDLSRRRAETVAAALQDVATGPITVRAHGKRQPVAANQYPDGSDNPEGRQRNRRVQLELAPAAQ